jgi:hypothetical protein
MAAFARSFADSVAAGRVDAAWSCRGFCPQIAISPSGSKTQAGAGSAGRAARIAASVPDDLSIHMIKRRFEMSCARQLGGQSSPAGVRASSEPAAARASLEAPALEHRLWSISFGVSALACQPWSECDIRA